MIITERVAIVVACGCGYRVTELIHEAGLVVVDKVEQIAELFQGASDIANWYDEWCDQELVTEREKYPLIRKIVLKSQCVPKRFIRLARSRL